MAKNCHKRKKPDVETSGFLVLLARPERFERPTPWFVAKYSIQLSYGRALEKMNYMCRFRLCQAFSEVFIKKSFGGDGGIRTLDTSFSPYAPLAGECLRPLGHVSKTGAGSSCLLRGADNSVLPAPGQINCDCCCGLTRSGPGRRCGAGCARPVPGTFRRPRRKS